MNGDFDPFAGLTHRAGEKFGVPKDDLYDGGGVLWPDIECGTEMVL